MERSHLEAVVDSAPEAIVAMDLDGLITVWNRRSRELLGYEASEVLGTPAHRMIPEELAQAEDEAFCHLRQGKPVSHRETTRLHKDGTRVLVAVSEAPLFDPASRIIGTSSILRDLAEQAGTLDRLKRTMRELSDFQAALNEHAIVAVTDTRGFITYANDKFCEISKYDREELLGQDHRIVNSGHHSREFMRELWTTIGRGRIWKGEIKNRAKDGSNYWVETTIVPNFTESGRIRQYVVLRTDITPLKAGEEALRQTQQQLRQLAGRLIRVREEERTRMSREVHDGLGQVLTGLKMDLRWIERRLPPDLPADLLRTIRERLAGCTGLADESIRLVQQIATELRPGTLDTLGLADAIREEARRSEDRLGIPFRLELPLPQPAVSPEVATAFFRILQELIANILRHAAARSVTIRLGQRGADAELQVEDDGRGMSVEAPSRSTSLGLLSIRERAEALGGWAEFHGALGRGTLVTVRIPTDRGTSQRD